MALGNELCQDLGINCISFYGSMVSGTVLRWRSGAKWNWGRVCHRSGAPHSDSLLSGFVGLQHVDAILKKKLRVKRCYRVRKEIIQY